MPGLDDDVGDDEGTDDPSGPRPAPSDRPWVHPAELQAFRAAPATGPEPPRPREWVIGLLSAAAGVAATLLVLVAFGAIGGQERTAVPPAVVTLPESPIDYAIARRVAASAGESVVTVLATPDAADPAGSPTRGSGVILRTDRVVTSAHLVSGASKVEVTTKTGKTLTAEVLGVDPSTDLCLLLVADVGPELPELELVAEPAVGDPVVALGAGKSNEGWTSMGVIQEENWIASNGAVAVAGLLATSTDTTAPTAGGGLFDENGRIIAILVSAPGERRSGLALPIDVVFDVAEQLEQQQSAAHGAVGVVFGANRVGKEAGATVAGVVPDGPAATAAPPLQAGDRIVRAGDDLAIRGMEDLIAAARRRQPGEQLELTFVRNGRAQVTRVTLGTAGATIDSPFGPVG